MHRLTLLLLCCVILLSAGCSNLYLSAEESLCHTLVEALPPALHEADITILACRCTQDLAFLHVSIEGSTAFYVLDLQLAQLHTLPDIPEGVMVGGGRTLSPTRLNRILHRLLDGDGKDCKKSAILVGCILHRAVIQ